MKVILVAGARPNFMKIAPVLRAMDEYNTANGKLFEPFLVHTGQHYNDEMSKVFFEDLDLPEPDIDLGIGSGSHAEQTAGVMMAIEKVFLDQEPDLVIVVGDVNSTVAAAITASKLHIPVAHVEAGLRSFDTTMPEERNRVVTDVLSDILFTTDRVADENLTNEGVDSKKVFLVGNVMVDTLRQKMDAVDSSSVLEKLDLEQGEYAVLTLHRAGTVDNKDVLERILGVVSEISSKLKVVFPRHPRTTKRMEEFGISGDGLTVTEPLGYVDFVRLVRDSRIVLTDSGGLQNEAVVLGTPCVTLRDTTEWPMTVEMGANVLVGSDPERIREETLGILEGKRLDVELPELWDGRAAERIVDVLRNTGQTRLTEGNPLSVPSLSKRKGTNI